uniref:Uncharacterized protein n=1 Tax=Corethron hystrix TaxID=216773 RepID=A0A7S1BDM7_9STRA|mmetsp:Transcript_21567/g.49016  ORF Transcript_21567/g.49016 Transcript_21567/m.49016 type:complete len:284 (+) Transcript_21567:449-1300(+)|eukprot:CAMPEP_0113312274 /NCGR_PEP_ID=MMETSP0010_2-20120614/9166_1 /TAXON_ID=216773 ORGANISM="Corethron hystrix, Strain 308" /NCGR_SAMPLE_ID=MMETSP0010_2 /ASSEMBLY_ACC=CAM_ASM_000155 /LENGTH=283 /DNA_ID=CAMNT_0000168059 /DNA_START=381 /DNA_END=1232 /DNA_ORIENTATION=- /assembly_acc=CAM_ASM_000155
MSPLSVIHRSLVLGQALVGLGFQAPLSASFPLQQPQHNALRHSPPSKSNRSARRGSTQLSVHGAIARPLAAPQGIVPYLNRYDSAQASYALFRSSEDHLADAVLHDLPASTDAEVSSNGAAARALAFISAHYPPCSLARDELRSHVGAVLHHGQRLRESDEFGGGRITLGICAPNVGEALACLKGYVGANALPRGLLHGMDEDGVPIAIEGPVYVRYCNGGCRTFAEMRRSRLGWEGLWHPGDASVETYNGEYAGVYVNVEMEEAEGRQWGLMPLDLFTEDMQ